MPFFEAVRVAVASLRVAKLRAGLTILGIFIGVSSVISVVAITEGLDRYMADRVLRLGSKSFSVQKMPDLITSHSEFLAAFKRKNLDLADGRAVRARCTLCSEVGAMVGTSQDVKWRSTVQENVRIMGVTENFSRIGAVRDLLAGRHLIGDDVDRSKPVAVIGADLQGAFFRGMEPLGKTLLIAGRALRVVGVAEREGSIFGASQDNFVWIPISTFQKLFGARGSVTIQAEAHSMAVFEEAQDQARLAMRVRHRLSYDREDDFAIETGESIMEFWQSATRGIYVVTLIVTAISLLVAAVVVMNIMLVSVTERVSEIGLRKALGARRRDVLRQFLAESVILTTAGGVLGVLGAALFAHILGGLLGRLMEARFEVPIELWAVALALAMSSTVGLIAGIYPAGRAAKLDPVEALRNE